MVPAMVATKSPVGPPPEFVTIKESSFVPITNGLPMGTTKACAAP
jgi:hypothetical protein